MASLEAAGSPSIDEVTNEVIEISPTVEEALSPTDPKINEPEGTILSDEENVKEFEEKDEKAEELSPINQEPEQNVKENVTEFNEDGEEKEDGDDEEHEDD